MVEKHSGKKDGGGFDAHTMGHWLTMKPTIVQDLHLGQHHRANNRRSTISPSGASRYIRGPMPEVFVSVEDLLELKCNMCTWVSHGMGRWMLKYINRLCEEHRDLAGAPEVSWHGLSGV